ncbi:MAG: hypothetical protein PHQ33_05895, partial [Bacteroidales bacterium]|nr:hypothetical protein [Bacteroidales bacterium]
MEDNYYLFQGAKKSLIRWLADNGITDTGVLRAFDVIERHQFIEDHFLQQKAYENMPLPIACDQTISQPITVAFQSQLLQIKTEIKSLKLAPVPVFKPPSWQPWVPKFSPLNDKLNYFGKHVYY